MNRTSAYLFPIVAIGACCASTSAFADNPVGFYVGAGVGESYLDNDSFSGNYRFDGHDTAWKALVGIRPLPIVGAELEYIDFGNPGGPFNNYGFGDNFGHVSGNDAAKATTLFGVGYLPLPLPFLDVYGKAGVARLQSNVSDDFPGGFSLDRSSTNFAWGLGVQSRFLFGLGVRAEFERIQASGVNPEALTVGATWTF